MVQVKYLYVLHLILIILYDLLYIFFNYFDQYIDFILFYYLPLIIFVPILLIYVFTWLLVAIAKCYSLYYWIAVFRDDDDKSIGLTLSKSFRTSDN